MNTNTGAEEFTNKYKSDASNEVSKNTVYFLVSSHKGISSLERFHVLKRIGPNYYSKFQCRPRQSNMVSSACEMRAIAMKYQIDSFFNNFSLAGAKLESK